MMVIRKDFFHSLLEDSGMLEKQADKTSKPTFKPDEKVGEGRASDEELKYRAELLDELKKVYNVYNNIKNLPEDEYDKRIGKAIDHYIKNGKEIVKKNVDAIYQTSIETGIKKLEKLDIKAEKPKLGRDIYTALLNWQYYSIEKLGEQLRIELKNKRLAKQYFEAAYG